jgi:hypothetical protein
MRVCAHLRSLLLQCTALLRNLAVLSETYTYVHTYIHTCMHIYMCVYIRNILCVCVHVCVYVCNIMRCVYGVCVCIFIYGSTCMHACTRR